MLLNKLYKCSSPWRGQKMVPWIYSSLRCENILWAFWRRTSEIGHLVIPAAVAVKPWRVGCQPTVHVYRHMDLFFLLSVELQDCSQRQLLGRGWKTLVPPLWYLCSPPTQCVPQAMCFPWGKRQESSQMDFFIELESIFKAVQHNGPFFEVVIS